MLEDNEGIYRTVLVYSDGNMEYIKRAKSYSALSHYTKIEALKKILISKKIRFTNIGKLKGKNEQYSVGGKMYSDYLFSLSFTHRLENSDKMWEKFGDNYKGVKITVYFDKNIEDLIDKNSLAEGMNDGKVRAKFEISGKESNYLYNEELLKKGILVQLHYNDVEYINKSKLDFESSFKIKDRLYLDLNKLGKVGNKYKYQEETRISAVLMGNEKTNEIDYLYMPLNFEKLKEIRIEFGMNCKPNNIEEIENIIKSEHLKNIKLIKAEE